jgi:transcriptional regulator with XRE-family HTH domain
MYRLPMVEGPAGRLAAVIQRIRQESGLGRAEFGERIKVTEEAVRLYETGERTPSSVVLKRILDLGRVPKATAKTLLHLRNRLPHPPALDEKVRKEVAERILRVIEVVLEGKTDITEDIAKDLRERIGGVLEEEFDGHASVQPEEPRARVREQQPAHPEGGDQRRSRQAGPHFRDW